MADDCGNDSDDDEDNNDDEEEGEQENLLKQLFVAENSSRPERKLQYARRKTVLVVDKMC